MVGLGGLLVAATCVPARATEVRRPGPAGGWSPAPAPAATLASPTPATPALPPGAGTAGAAPQAQRAQTVIDGREVLVPIPGAERLRIDNPLGNVTIRAWDRAEAMHIVAEKQSTSREALSRLRVHFTAWAGGEISVETRVEAGGRERAMPLTASRIDLVIEVPPDLEIEAKTFAGELTASGLRAGARLETTAGRIAVSDVHGRVVTHQLRGGQYVVAVAGDVDLDGVEGHMQIERLEGARLEARVVDGDIRAEDIRSDEVRLGATTGEVVLVGLIQPRARYDLRSYEGAVKLIVAGAPRGFELRARSPQPIASALPLQMLWQRGDRMRATVAPVGAHGEAGTPSRGRPVIELSSVLGRVVLETAVALDETSGAR